LDQNFSRNTQIKKQQNLIVQGSKIKNDVPILKVSRLQAIQFLTSMQID